MIVTLYEAKTQLSKLLDRVLDGEEIVIGRAGKAVARLVPFRGSRHREYPADLPAGLSSQKTSTRHLAGYSTLSRSRANLLLDIIVTPSTEGSSPDHWLTT